MILRVPLDTLRVSVSSKLIQNAITLSFGSHITKFSRGYVTCADIIILAGNGMCTWVFFCVLKFSVLICTVASSSNFVLRMPFHNLKISRTPK